MTELSQQEIIDFPLIPHGRWWKGIDSQKFMLDVYHDEGGFAMSWDNGYGGKQFGVYSKLSKLEFMQHLLDLPLGYRNAYEMLVEDVPCRAYLDVDYEGPPDPSHTTLQRLVAVIRNKIRDDYGKDPKIYVCCGSRPSKDDPETIVKHSYHIVCANIIFDRNNDGLMKKFFTSIENFVYQKDFEEKSIIDSAVYTKNRHFRTVHSCKRGSTTPLVRISGDPLLDRFDHDWGRDAQAVLPFFISNPDIDSDCIRIHTPTPLLELSMKNMRGAGPKRAKTDQHSTLNKVLPVPLEMVQRLLVLAGDDVTKLGSVQYLPDEDRWQIQGDQRGKGRKCLSTAGITHSSNNCLLFVEKFQTGFKVHYFCTASECSHQCKPILGYIMLNLESMEWQPSMTLKQAAQETETLEQMETEAETTEQMETDLAPPPQEAQQDDQEMSDSLPVPPHDPDNPDLNTYELVKARFEKKCFKVEVPFCYARITSSHEPCLHSHVDLQHYFCDLTCWAPNKDGDIVKMPFITMWLKDPNKRMVEKIVVDPTKTMQGVYNMWKGFDAEKLPPIQDNTTVLELIKPITKHVNDVITEGNVAHTEFIHHYLANMLQRPWQKSQVAISLYGAQGCGKGIIFEFFRQKILGTHCSFQTSKPENDLFGRFANGAVNRVCIQIDEVKSLHDHSDQLKDFITNPTVNYEKKGKDLIVVSNFANLILTSNNANALTVSMDDRRFALFHCSSVHKGNTQYFTELGAHLAQPRVARAYYQYLMSMDLSEYPTSFQHKRPVTEYYHEVQQNSIPVISRFFSALVNAEFQDKNIPARELYKKYVQFQTDGNYKFIMTETSFGRDAKKIVGVSMNRTKISRFYHLDYEAIKKHLQTINQYDPDAEN